MIPTIYKADSFITFIDGRSITFTKEHPLFKKVVELYQKQKWNDIRQYFSMANYIARASHGKISVYDDVVYYDGEVVHNHVAKRIIDMLSQGFDILPMVKFLDKLMRNPEHYIRQDLFLFMEKNHLAITSDGDIVAFKLTNEDGSPFYYSSSSIRYEVGKEVSMPRGECYRGRDECGGAGLYVGNREYWGVHFDSMNRYNGPGRMFICRVSPEDVTSVPIIENGRKLICCRLFILDEYERSKEAATKAVFTQEKPFYNVRDEKGRFVKRAR